MLKVKFLSSETSNQQTNCIIWNRETCIIYRPHQPSIIHKFIKYTALRVFNMKTFPSASKITVWRQYNRKRQKKKNLSNARKILPLSVVTVRTLFSSSEGNPPSCGYVWVGFGVDERLGAGVWVHSMAASLQAGVRTSWCLNKLWGRGAAVEVIPGLNLLATGVTNSKLCRCEFNLHCVLLIIYSGVKWYHGDFLMPSFPQRTLEVSCWRWKQLSSKWCAVGDMQGAEDKFICG